MNGRLAVCDRPPTREGGEGCVAAGIIGAIDSVVLPGAKEIDHEAGTLTRGLLTDTHTMLAGDLCGAQGQTASRGFLDLFRG